MSPVGELEFRGTGRFSVQRRLGAGAFGVVYEAFDRERNSLVALKTLRQANVEALYRLKKEFRALSDLSHPNLVSLYELLADGDQWFFTMELVEGENFLDYVRGSRRAPDDSLDPTVPFSAVAPGPTPRTVTFAPVGGSSIQEGDAGKGLAAWSGSPDVARLRGVLRQAVCGLNALHEAGKLHRDIKPSNVLVSRDGRLVLLDFGLVTELGPRELERSLTFAGTPAYMSPEQGVGISEASDWYSLGVMLFEALTGRKPFAGTLSDLMWSKLYVEPPSPRQIVPDVPGDLNDLCRDLLRREPRERPGGEEILKRLGAVQAATFDAGAVSAQSVPPRAAPFVGRQAQLAALREAFEASRRSQAVTVYLSGTSGMGKTVLVRHFLEELRSENVVALAGRCYERESVPYKALDSLVDALSDYLKRLPPEHAEGLLPRDILALARVFPVLRRVEAVAGTRRKVVEIADAFELRRRAFTALRELLARLAEKEDVVLFIDDLQWGDADSATLLAELMRPPDPPPLLLIASYRSEEAGTSPLLKQLLPKEAAAESSDLRRLSVDELSASEARDLASALLGQDAVTSATQAEAIARESGGNPFFIDELVRFDQAGVERPRGKKATLDEVVRERVLRLPQESRRLLEVVAVAGQPLELTIAASVADLEAETQVVSHLRAGHLVRIRATPDREQIEAYHDRIREAVLAQLLPDVLRNHHHRLAVTLEASGRADPEKLALHFQEAAEPERAAEYARSAADRAAEALAFDRAARLYRLALELGDPGEGPARRSLNQKMGDALANAGRGRDAALAYLAAAEGATRVDSLTLESHAAEQLLWAGHVDQALPIFERVTGKAGLTLVQPSWRTSLMYLCWRTLIRLRGLSFRERDASQVPPEQLIRLDSYWMLTRGLVLISSLRARELSARHVLMALKAGEPSRMAIAFAKEATSAAFVGWRARNRVDRLLTRAIALAERVREPHAIGLTHTYGSAAVLYLGRWQACLQHGQTAEATYRERCTGVAWELDFTRIVSLRGLFYLGRLRELAERLPSLIREARERDDLMAVSTLQIRQSYVPLLAMDEPQKARENLQQAVQRWSQKTFGNQHYWAFLARGEIFLFEGSGKAAWDALQGEWQEFKRSGLIRIQFYRIEALHLRARSAVAQAAEGGLQAPEKEFLFKAAERDSRQLEREGAPWGKALARLIRASIAAARERPSEALRLLESVEPELTRLGMALYAAAARRRRGALLGGDDGRDLVENADAWMAGENIKNPAQMTAMLAPGTWS